MALKRKNLLAGATKRNPLVVQLSNDLTDLRINILNSIDNYISNINTSLSEFKDFQNQTNSEVSKFRILKQHYLLFSENFKLLKIIFVFASDVRKLRSVMNRHYLIQE